MALAVLVAHCGGVVGNETEWLWFYSGSSSSLSRETNIFFFPFSSSVFACFSSYLCLCFVPLVLLSSLSLFSLVSVFLISSFFLSSPISFSLFCSVSLLYSSTIFLFSLVLSFWSSQNVPPFISLFLFFFKIFLSQQNSLLCSPFCSSLYLLPKCSPPLFVLVSLLSNLYFFSFSRPQILYSFVPSFLSCPLIFLSVCLLYLKSLYILH